MPPKRKAQQQSLEGFVSSSPKKARIEHDVGSPSEHDEETQHPQPSSSTEAYIKELPGKIATHDAAAAVDANPPLGQLLNLMGEARQVALGQSVVYWMRNEDMRGIPRESCKTGLISPWL